MYCTAIYADTYCTATYADTYVVFVLVHMRTHVVFVLVHMRTHVYCAAAYADTYIVAQSGGCSFSQQKEEHSVKYCLLSVQVYYYIYCTGVLLDILYRCTTIYTVQVYY